MNSSRVEKFHVMTVSATQQMVIRLALNEYFRRQAEYLIAAASAGDVQDSDTMIERYDQYFENYEVCAAGLPSLMSLKHTPAKALYLTNSAMRYMVEAINQYDPTAAQGPSQLKSAIESVYPKLKTLANLSLEYQYTASEIKQAGG